MSRARTSRASSRTTRSFTRGRRRTSPADPITASLMTAACRSSGGSMCPCTARPTPGGYGIVLR
eukprot:7223524-Prymnesium_polylepis.1